jgi:hypothetical protein
VAADEMDACTGDSDGESEGELDADDLGGGEGGECEKATVPIAPAPAEEKPTSAPMGNMMRASHLGRSVVAQAILAGLKRRKDARRR